VSRILAIAKQLLSVKFAGITSRPRDNNYQVRPDVMNNSYRLHAERRASLSRAPVSAPRASVRPPLELPPWGYGSGRPVLSTPLPTVNSSKRLTRPRTRSVWSAKQTNSYCERVPAQLTAAGSRPNIGNVDLSEWPNLVEYSCEGTELPDATVDMKSAADTVAASNEIQRNIATVGATAVSTQHPNTLQGAVDNIGNTVVIGGGPVASSSMETWTTYDGASSSQQTHSPINSPHSVTPELNSTSHTPLMSPLSATSWLHRLSPTALMTAGAPLDLTLVADAANRETGVTSTLATPASPSSDVTDSRKSITSTTQPTAEEPTTVAELQEVAVSPPCSADRSHEQKRVASPVNICSPSGELTIDTPTSLNSSNDGNATPLHRVASKTDSAKSPKSSSTTLKSSLMVGLVKVKSRHTGLMVDCPILETIYQNEAVESSATSVRRSSNHKVVLIKAVVPRSAWNGRGQFTSNRSNVDSEVNRRKSLVSVNTQTSDTLLSVRHTISEHQSIPPSPIPVNDTHKYVPALEDSCQLKPSPKHSACLCKSAPKTPSECDLQSSLAESCVPSSPNNTSCLSSAHARNNNLTPAETSSLPTSPLSYGNVPMMSEKPKESEFMAQPSASMDYDSLMEDTLKLDLQFDSSDSNSDKQSATHEKAGKRSSSRRLNCCSSSSTDDVKCDHQPLSSYQALPKLNWSYAPAASSDAVENFKTSPDMAVRMELSSSSPRQKPTSVGRSQRTTPSQCRSPISNFDNRKPRADDVSQRLSNNICQSSPNSSQRNDTKVRLAPDGYCRPNRSPCPWRSATSNDDEPQNWPEGDVNCKKPRQHHHHSQPPQQHISSRTESSLSDRSKSTFHGCYEVTATKVTSTMSSTSSISPHTEQSSTLPTRQLVTSGGSDTCATSVSMQHHHRTANKFRSNTAGEVESTTHHSRHNHRRSTSTKKHRAIEQSSPTQERYKMLTSGAKRSAVRQHKWSIEATRRRDVAQSSQSTGSVSASRNARLLAAAGKRQQSSLASAHVPRNARTDKHIPARHISADRRASSASRGQYCSIRDNQRRSRVHSENRLESDPVTRRSNRQNPSSGRDKQHANRATNASLSRSADSMSRQRGRPRSDHANYPTSAAKQSNSSQPKRADNRLSHHRGVRQSQAMFYECRQPVVYCSPRSLKPFPPPISDRHPPSSFDSSPAGTSLDAESVSHVFVQRQDDSDYINDRPSAPPLNVTPPRRQQRLRHATQNGTGELDHQRRGNTSAVGSGNGARRRKKLPATRDCQAWYAEPEVSVRTAVPSLNDRPAWRQY